MEACRDTSLLWQSLCRERAVWEPQPEAFPHIDQCFSERVDQRVIVKGRRRNAQPLGAAREGRIVDRLDVSRRSTSSAAGRRAPGKAIKTEADQILMKVVWRAWLRSPRVAILIQAITSQHRAVR
jgi:hypothetical protein